MTTLKLKPKNSLEKMRDIINEQKNFAPLTVHLDPELFQRFKVRAAVERKTFKDIVSMLIENYLQEK